MIPIVPVLLLFGLALGIDHTPSFYVAAVSPSGANAKTVGSSANAKTTANDLDAMNRGRWITQVWVQQTVGTAVQGRYYAIAQLYRGGLNVNPIANLWSGYVTQVGPVSLPNVRCMKGYAVGITVWSGTNGSASDEIQAKVVVEDNRGSGSWIYHQPPGSVRGEMISTAVANPAAGADISISVGAGVRQQFISLSCKLATSAVGANRLTKLGFTDSVKTIFALWSTANMTASLTWFLQFGVPSHDVVTATGLPGSGAFTLPVPSVLMLPTWTYGTSTANIDVGDQFSLVQSLVEEWAWPDP